MLHFLYGIIYIVLYGRFYFKSLLYLYILDANLIIVKITVICKIYYEQHGSYKVIVYNE